MDGLPRNRVETLIYCHSAIFNKGLYFRVFPSAFKCGLKPPIYKKSTILRLLSPHRTNTISVLYIYVFNSNFSWLLCFEITYISFEQHFFLLILRLLFVFLNCSSWSSIFFRFFFSCLLSKWCNWLASHLLLESPLLAKSIQSYGFNYHLYAIDINQSVAVNLRVLSL